MKRALVFVLLIACAGCGQKMSNQGRMKPFEASAVFADGTSARPAVPNTVPREFVLTGTAETVQIPVPVTTDLLHRGQHQFNIYCVVCHGRDGYGDGIIVRHGFTPPPSFHTPRLRGIADGHFYSVITNGIGAMYSYADRVAPEDRWAIVAYVRALQLSQNADAQHLSANDQKKLRELAP